jgi:3-oxoadipate enol-lactonase
MIDLGAGPPLVMIPGIQGHWEWMAPAISALARRCRVISYSLRDAPPEFDSFVHQLDAVLDEAKTGPVTLCGVSFGGWIAVRYAALRPQKVNGLILASAPSPSWRLDKVTEQAVTSPRIRGSLFLLGSVTRFAGELTGIESVGERWRFALRQCGRVIRRRPSPKAMSARVRTLAGMNLAADCARVPAPTLVITGEPDLDRIVPVSETCDYLTLIPGAKHITLERTGHMGLVVRPDAFAEIVVQFMREVTEPAGTVSRASRSA